MNNKITFPRLAALLADKSGRSKRFSEDFLREMFALISERLEAGESVKVKSLGTFRLSKVEPRKSVDVNTGQPMEISGHTKVVFTPAKELAEAINAPFEAFSAIEIGDDVDLDAIVSDEDIIVQDDSEDILLTSNVTVNANRITQSVENQDKTAVKTPVESPVETPDSIVLEETTAESSDAPDYSVDDVPENSRFSENETDFDYPVDDVPNNTQSSENTDDSAQRIGPKVMTNKTNFEDDDDIFIVNEGSSRDSRSFDKWNDRLDEPDSHKVNWVKTLLICAACAVLGIVITFVVWSLATKPDFSDQEKDKSALLDQQEYPSNQDEYASDNHAVNVDEEFYIDVNDEDIVPDPVPTAPSDAVVYDTIGNSRYLTTMAKDHYGNNKFWPYIYEENKNHIGHPDKIRPGTPIVIPKLSKYGVDPSNPSDVEKATRLGVEIYARYGIKL